MASSPQEMAQNWAAGMQDAGAAWDAAKPQMEPNWVAGLQRAGVTVGPLTRAKYNRRISQASGAKLVQSASAGGAEKYIRNYLAKMSR